MTIETKIEKDVFPMFKRWLKSHLKHGPVTVIFTKKDGTERTMLCTTNENLIPQVIHETNTDNPIDFPVGKSPRKVNPDLMSVYDLEAAGWRSFRWDSLKQVRFEL